MVDPAGTPCAWRCEPEMPSWLEKENLGSWSPDEILLATEKKKQRTEVKLAMLSPEEQKAFSEAKDTEGQNWLKTGTVSRIPRTKLAPEQILRCRWILTWKPREETKSACDTKMAAKLQSHKPKARLVVLGYTDPQITEVPRGSPTLAKQPKMILLQLVASMGWSLGSFDIKAAFLQSDRIIGLEPVILVSKLGFKPCPFDSCFFILRDPQDQKLAGVLGIHVDDGIYGGNGYFQSQIAKLEEKYLFGPKKSRKFTFTGIDLQQNSDNSIEYHNPTMPKTYHQST